MATHTSGVSQHPWLLNIPLCPESQFFADSFFQTIYLGFPICFQWPLLLLGNQFVCPSPHVIAVPLLRPIVTVSRESGPELVTHWKAPRKYRAPGGPWVIGSAWAPNLGSSRFWFWLHLGCSLLLYKMGMAMPTQLGKVPGARKVRGQKRKRASEDEVGREHHWCNRHELGQAPRDGKG